VLDLEDAIIASRQIRNARAAKPPLRHCASAATAARPRLPASAAVIAASWIHQHA
jgi:hypothetical protein